MKRHSIKRIIRTHNVEFHLFVVILCLFTAISLNSRDFFSWENIITFIDSNSFMAIAAAGLLVVLVCGEIDISFSATASCAQYIAAIVLVKLGWGNWLTVLGTACIAGMALGIANACIVHYAKLTSIIVTIATLNIYFSMLMFLTKGRSIYTLPSWWTDKHAIPLIPGISLTLPVVVTLAIYLVTWVLLTKTALGRQITAVGGNLESARRIGVNIFAIRAFAYGYLGCVAGIAGVMQAHRVQEVVPNALFGIELNVLAAVVLGGASLMGGRGSVLGAALGVFLIAMLQNALNLLGVSSYLYGFVIGLLILIAVTATRIHEKRLSART